METLLCPLVRKTALAICDGYATQFAHRVRNHIDYEDWDGLVNLKLDPSTYKTAESYFADAACLSFLKKYEPLPTKVDRRAAAVSAFFEAERECFRTNQRLSPYLTGQQSPEDDGVARHIAGIRKEILSIVGHRPKARLISGPYTQKASGIAFVVRKDGTRKQVSFQPPRECGLTGKIPQPIGGRFGPGSTFGDRGVYTTLPDKLTSRPTITSSAAWFLLDYGSTLWASTNAELRRDPTFVRGNRFVTVPKDATKDRGICVGASINLFYQLGLGRAMKDCLKASGIDLTRAPITHAQVARRASITGEDATIDLRQASDSICKVLVKLCWPSAWHDTMFDLREPSTLIDDRWYQLEKFSAMGNGYTFEMETITFLGVCMHVMREHGITPVPGVNVHVFGDDIIVPTSVSKDVIAVLRYLGFQTNESKTFVDGPFRESCGGDFFNGTPVRPYFLKEEPNEPQQKIAMANGIWAMGHPDPRYNFRWDHVRHAWFCVLDAIPSDIKRLRGPSDLGDSVIHDEPEYWQTRTRSSRRYIRGYVTGRPLNAVHRKHFHDSVVLASAVYGMIWGQREYVVPRDALFSYRKRWLAYS